MKEILLYILVCTFLVAIFFAYEAMKSRKKEEVDAQLKSTYDKGYEDGKQSSSLAKHYKSYNQGFNHGYHACAKEYGHDEVKDHYYSYYPESDED